MPAGDPHPPRDADATRARLLRAAQRRFVLFGYDKTTTREIAADAQANVSLINRYFGGKRGLFEAVTAASAELITDAVRVEGDPLETFFATMDPPAWPELGAHPLLLLLRDDGDEELRALRRAALELSAERVGAGADDPLRAQLALALLCGTLALRRLGLLQPLSDAGPDALRAPLRDALDALRGPQRS